MRPSPSCLRFLCAALVGASAIGAAARADAPAPAVVAPAAGSFTHDQVVAALTRDLASHFNLEGDLQLELLRAWTPPSRAATKWTLEVLEYPLMPSSSMMVRCRLAADGEGLGETTLICRAALWRDVWVARQPLEAGTGFDPALLDVRRIDFFRERDVVPATAGDRSLVITRAVSAGRLLTGRDLNRRPLVKKGQLVEVSAVDGLLSITMKALAMENGAQGDTVTVRNPETRKDFSALVIDENHVQVHF